MILPRPFLLSFTVVESVEVVGLAVRDGPGGRGEGWSPGGGGLAVFSAPSLRLIPDAICLPAVDITCLALAPA